MTRAHRKLVLVLDWEAPGFLRDCSKDLLPFPLSMVKLSETHQVVAWFGAITINTADPRFRLRGRKPSL